MEKLQYPVDIDNLKYGPSSGYMIYCIRNTSNGKIYIGQTRQCLKKRLQAHRKKPPRKMRADMESNEQSDQSWPQTFSVFVLEVVRTSREANVVESKFIRMFKSNTSEGYNDPLMVGHPFGRGMYQQLYR